MSSILMRLDYFRVRRHSGHYALVTWRVATSTSSKSHVLLVAIVLGQRISHCCWLERIKRYLYFSKNLEKIWVFIIMQAVRMDDMWFFLDWVTWFNELSRKKRREVPLQSDKWAAHGSKDAMLHLSNVPIRFLFTAVTSCIRPCEAGLIACVNHTFKNKLQMKSSK